MPNPPESPPPPEVPDFTPVPGRSRRDGWTPERQRAFLVELQSSQSVTRAAAAVGKSRESAYRLRERPGAESFAAAWSRIMASRPVPPPDPNSLWHRAMYGVLKPVVRKGEVVAHLLQPDNRAAMALLRRFDRAAARCSRSEGHGAKNTLAHDLCDFSALPPGPELDALLAIEARFDELPSFTSSGGSSHAGSPVDANPWTAAAPSAALSPAGHPAAGNSPRQKRAGPSTS